MERSLPLAVPGPGTRGRPRAARRRERKALLRFACYLMCAVGLALVVASRSARVAGQAQEIVALREELRLVEADNRRLEMEALRLASLDRIEREAKVRLGMRQPTRVLPVPAAGDAAPDAALARGTPAPPEREARGGAGPRVQYGAATGLTLNAEAAALVDRLLQRLARALTGG